MKKILLLCLILVWSIMSSVQAFEWAYHFVVWDGKEYEVKEEELIDESEIGEMIGKVETEPYYFSDVSDAMRYSGDASNVSPIGTPYYEIKGIPTSTAIAVKVDNKWVKADYRREAPQHISEFTREESQHISKNTSEAADHTEDTGATKTFNLIPVAIFMIGLIIFACIYGVKKFRRQI